MLSDTLFMGFFSTDSLRNPKGGCPPSPPSPQGEDGAASFPAPPGTREVGQLIQGKGRTDATLQYMYQ